MIEKMLTSREAPYTSGYFRPKGRYEKRSIHKLIRRMKDLDTNRKGIYNRIGVHLYLN